MTTTTREFEVGQQPVLSLDHVSAYITTLTGPANQITVHIEGSQRYIDSLTIEQDGDTVVIREPEGADGGGVAVVSTGRGGQRNVFVSGRGGVVSTGSITGSVITGSGRIVVNGVDVTKLARQAEGVEDEPNPVITITAPAGTNTQIERCADVTLQHGGRLQGTVGSQGRLLARAIVSARLAVRGQSTASVDIAGGTLTAEVGGQSTLRFAQHGTNVHLSVSGQSSVRGDGRFDSVTGSVSGQSDVRITGEIGTDSLTTSGQSGATVNGRPSGYRPAPRRAGAWDF